MKLTDEQRALADVMSAISERIWRAGWITGNEYILWADLIDQSGWPKITEGERRILRVLSDLVGGWIIWRDGETFVSTDEWKAIVAERAE